MTFLDVWLLYDFSGIAVWFLRNHRDHKEISVYRAPEPCDGQHICRKEKLIIFFATEEDFKYISENTPTLGLFSLYNVNLWGNCQCYKNCSVILINSIACTKCYLFSGASKSQISQQNFRPSWT